MVTQDSCKGCNKIFRKKSKTGYCGICFHSDVDGVRLAYSRERWLNGVAKMHHWKTRGADLSQEDVEHYNACLSCQICHKEFTNDKCLDHDHKTGKYRGALCRQCNAALGKFGDNLEVAISRLTAYQELVSNRSLLGFRRGCTL